MKRTYAQTVALVRSGLSGEAPPPELFTGVVDWQEIYSLSSSQTVVCIVTDGISHLPDPLKPGIEALEPFLADTLATEIRNDQMDRFLVFLMDNIDRSGFTSVLIKGQGLAVNYPAPSHRQSGDIDILVHPSKYQELKGLLLEKASRADDEYPEILHHGMMFGNIEVEVHGALSTMLSRSLDRKIAAAVDAMFRDGDFSSVTIRGRQVRVPSDVFNAVYILIHLFRHYFTGGVGLRQILDWAEFLHTHSETLDRAKLEAMLRDLGLMRAWRAFGAFVVEYAGVPAESVPFYRRGCRGRSARILNFVFKCGNFGSNEQRIRGSEPYLIRKIHSFFLLDVHDKFRHFFEFPVDSLRFFFGAVTYGFGRLFKGV
ncbi:MAG: nucleotidyltransferase family protein [Bacteroidales bacterium]|nr:nucleotidyltransferase family protein [Bacteroidales bacterium]